MSKVSPLVVDVGGVTSFGGAVPAFSALRIQRNSLQGFDFGNGKGGLYGLKGNVALAGTALDDNVFGKWWRYVASEHGGRNCFLI